LTGKSQPTRATTSTKGLRALHRAIGITCAPLLILTALCGGLLLLRKTGLYERKGGFRELIQSLHCYELLLPYVGLLACTLMVLVAVTGVVLFLRTRPRQRPAASTDA